MKLPNLKALVAFEAVARLLSIRRAAEELGIDHSLASRHLQSLQRDVGLPLIITSRQGVTLTQAGADYHRTIATTLNAIASATERMRSDEFAKRLMVSSIPGFALSWLTPRLPSFYRSFPDVDLLLRPADQPSDLDAGEADVVIHYGEVTGSNVRSQVLAHPRMFPVANPKWAESLPANLSVEALLDLPLIHEENQSQWHNWLRAAGVTVPFELKGPKLWHAHVAIEAARRGLGIALANDLIAAEGLASGELVEITRTDIRLASYVFATRADQWNRSAVVQLRQWLHQMLASN